MLRAEGMFRVVCRLGGRERQKRESLGGERERRQRGQVGTSPIFLFSVLAACFFPMPPRGPPRSLHIPSPHRRPFVALCGGVSEGGAEAAVKYLAG
jgi:hypothetical protein